MIRAATALCASLALASFAASAGKARAVAKPAPGASKVSPVQPGQEPKGCPPGTTLKVDVKTRKAGCVSNKPAPPLQSRGPTNPNCPKPKPGSKVTPKC